MHEARVAFGQYLAGLRRATGRGQTSFASLLCELAGTDTVTRNDVSRWERGVRVPEYWLPFVAKAAGVSENDLRRMAALAKWPDQVNPVAPPVILVEPPAQAGPVHETWNRVILGGQGSGDRPGEVSQTERREVLGIGVAGVAAAGLARSALSGPGLLHHSLEKGSISPERVAWIEHETSQLAYLGKHVPAVDRLLPRATELFDYISALVGEPQRTPDRVRLTRCAANLAGAIGEMTTKVRGFWWGEAWFRASWSAATDIGDQRLADMALTDLALNTLYEDKPAEALAVLASRLEHLPDRPTEATAQLIAVAGRAQAALGNGSASARHIGDARDALDRAPEPDPTWNAFTMFGPASMEFYAANAAGQLGDAATAMTAGDKALELFDPANNENRILVQFDKAVALRASGERDEACRVATAAIRDPNMFLGTAIRSRAAAFERGLGSGAGPATDWRDAYHDRLPPN